MFTTRANVGSLSNVEPMRRQYLWLDQLLRECYCYLSLCAAPMVPPRLGLLANLACAPPKKCDCPGNP